MPVPTPRPKRCGQRRQLLEVAVREEVLRYGSDALFQLRQGLRSLEVIGSLTALLGLLPVQQVNIAVSKFEEQPPVARHLDGMLAFQFSVQRVQIPVAGGNIVETGGGIQHSQVVTETVNMMGTNAPG